MLIVAYHSEMHQMRRAATTLAHALTSVIAVSVRSNVPIGHHVDVTGAFASENWTFLVSASDSDTVRVWLNKSKSWEIQFLNALWANIISKKMISLNVRRLFHVGNFAQGYSYDVKYNKNGHQLSHAIASSVSYVRVSQPATNFQINCTTKLLQRLVEQVVVWKCLVMFLISCARIQEINDSITINWY